MKKTIALVVAVSFLCGCAAMDKFVTGTPSSSWTADTQVSPALLQNIEDTGKLANSLGVPFAASGALGVGWLLQMYVTMRQRRLAKAGVLTIEAVRKFLNETPEGQVVDQKVKDVIIRSQKEQGVLSEVAKLVDRYTPQTRD
jgi:hypothetical protein